MRKRRPIGVNTAEVPQAGEEIQEDPEATDQVCLREVIAVAGGRPERATVPEMGGRRKTAGPTAMTTKTGMTTIVARLELGPRSSRPCWS